MSYIYFSGVDGSGKTSASNKLSNSKDRYPPLDKMVDVHDYTVYPDIITDSVVVLTADIDVLVTRIKNRDIDIDIFETRRSLFYFDSRYREMAIMYGLPLIDTTNITSDDVVSIIKSGGKKRVPLKDMTTDDVSLFVKITEGESKIVYEDPHDKDFCYIVLKDSIRSTGEIEDIGKLRGTGSRFFLEMMRRNELNHSYVAINDHGIVYSRRMYNINPIEIVVNEFCDGTDKHSYYNYRDAYTDKDGRYVNGPYVRFDWRNPNHLDDNGMDIRETMDDYYGTEKALGKKKFLDKYLVRPMGDKTISESLVTDTIFNDVNVVKTDTLKLYHTIRHYLSSVGITIKDVCFMMSCEDNGINYCWSEINQDCMRIVGTKFDNDLWRVGGSSREDQLMKKWGQVHDMVCNYFVRNPYDPAKYYYYEYQKSMESIDIDINTNHQDIYLKCCAFKTGRFVVKDNITSCFPDKIVTYDPEMVFMYTKYHPDVFVSNMDHAHIAIKNSARRVFINPCIGPITNQTIAVNVSIDRISETNVIGTIDDLHITTIDTSKYGKIFQYCETIDDAIRACKLGATPIVSSPIADSLWKHTVQTMTPTVIVQDVGGVIKEIIRECNINDINTDKYEEVSINHDTYDSIVCTVDSPGQSKSFSFQMPIKTNIIELQRGIGNDSSATVKIMQEMTKIDNDHVDVFYRYLRFLNNRGINITTVLDTANARMWDVGY